MSKNKKNTYVKKTFESNGAKNDTSANIYESMLLSPSWHDLSSMQRVLYLCCKSQLYSEYKKPIENNRKSFTMNRYKWLEKYKIYTDANAGSFYKDMEALINHGFIKCIWSGAIARQKSIYEFSDKWQIWDTPQFKVNINEMTSRMSSRITNKSGK